MNYGMDLFNVAVVNHSASLELSGGKILKFVFEPLEDKSFTLGECNSNCFKVPDATLCALLLLHTYASYLENFV